MGFFRGIGRVIKPLVNVPKWVGAKQIAEDANYISDLAKDLLKPQQATRKEKFEDAVKRLNLTDKELLQRYKEFKRLAVFFGVTFLILFAYIIYLLAGAGPETSWRAIALSTIVSLIALVQFFRFHFWMFQVKQQKLGCSLKDYFLHGLLGFKAGIKS